MVMIIIELSFLIMIEKKQLKQKILNTKKKRTFQYT